MPAILTTVATLDPGGDNALEGYASAVIPLIEAAQDTVQCRGTLREIIGAMTARDSSAVPEFPDAAHIHGMFASAAYRAAIPDRLRAFPDIKTFMSDSI